MGYTAWAKLQAGVLVGTAAWASTALLGLSGLAAAFCVYNVIAGGNPPRKGSH